MAIEPELRNPSATPYPERRSRPVEALLAEHADGGLACDVLILGSGYGGSFAAAELACEGRTVWVLERGREYARGEFPETLGELPGHVQLTRGTDRAPRGRRDALFDLRIDEDVAVLVGCGLGGGSLINAGVVLEPPPEVFDAAPWPQAIRDDRNHGLARAFEHVRRVLGAAPVSTPLGFPKYRALERLARAIPQASIRAAPIAVSRRDGPNAVGVEQRACIDCGNCVTGCNHDAKNTLAMNAIPLALDRGARFWTGARAIAVQANRDGPRVPGSGRQTRWCVNVDRVATLGAQRADVDTFSIHAHTVVIAAGSLGSTELLMRSRELGLRLSGRLGECFSGNGDQIAFGIGQRRAVGAVARPDPADPARWRPVGPTIVGDVSLSATGAGQVAAGRTPSHARLQDAAMPAALRPLLGTLMASAALTHGVLAHDAPHAFARHRKRLDTAGASEALVEHCQVLLAMSADAGTGTLRLDDAPPGQRERRLRISANYADVDPTISGVDAALASAARSAPSDDGFDGGWYVPNPLWKTLPDSVEQSFGKFGRRSITVHPLGGCVMAEDRTGGVVNHAGAVFDGDATALDGVHDGLHVLDGAILATSLGVNPMLTIAALAVRAAVRIDAALRSCEPAAEPRPFHGQVAARHATPPLERLRQPARDADIHLRFSEVLRTRAQERVDPGALGALIDAAVAQAQPTAAAGFAGTSAAQALREATAGLVLELHAKTQLAAWIAGPDTAWTGEATLSVRHVGDETETGHATLGSGSCRLELLRADAPKGAFDAWRRRLSVVRRFFADRPEYSLGRLLRRAARGTTQPPSVEHVTMRRRLVDLAVFRRLLERHLVWRELRYEITLRTATGAKLVLEGKKRLAYAHGGAGLWDALLELELHARSESARAGPWRMQVDVLDLLRRGVFRIDDAPDTPTAIAAVTAAGALWLRALAHSSLFSFPTPHRAAVTAPGPSESLSTLHVTTRSDPGTRREVRPDPVHFEVFRREHDRSSKLTLRLSRYRLEPRGRRPGTLLLVHGLAHGGEVFVTPTAPTPLAARFVAEGWDVFVLDHRLSAQLGDTPKQSSTIDDIAANDIPRAVEVIEGLLKADGSPEPEPIHVLAHCVGAAAVSMAVLSGRLTRDDGRSRIVALVLHAVHPWTVPSPWNRVSAALAGFYQDFLGDQVIDPIPPAADQASTADAVIDRLAASIAWSEDEWALHRRESVDEPSRSGHAICNRMTLFYGREWRHANLSQATHDALHTLVGPAHVDVFRHIFFLALRHRLTNANGENVYLSAENVGRHWTFPTLFTTGRDNQVFDPASAARAYQAMGVLRRQAEKTPGGASPSSLPGRAGLYLPAGVGHMDFLFGQFNHEPAPGPDRTEHERTGGGHGLQQTLVDFLRNPNAWLNANETDAAGTWKTARTLYPRMAASAVPWVGPLLRYRRSVRGGSIELEVWYEVHPHRTFGPATWVPQPPQVGPGWSFVDLTGEFARLRRGAELALPGAYWVATVPVITGLQTRPGARATPSRTAVSRGKPESRQRIPPIRKDGNSLWSNPLLAKHSGRARDGTVASSAGPGETQASTRPDEASGEPPATAPGFLEAVDAVLEELTGTTLSIPMAEIDRAHWLVHLKKLLQPGLRDRAMTFLLASCRWPGLVFERTAVDRPVRAMLERAGRADPAPIDALFLLGDEIYADAFADAFEMNAPAERAARRYREALSGDSRLDEHLPNAVMRELLAKLPCWSVVDDHEFVDNWPGASSASPPTESFRHQFAAAVAYQWRRCAADDGRWPGLSPGGVRRGLWQPFEAATLRCFALDTRTERTLRTRANLAAATIMGDAQQAALAAWLRQPPPGTDPDAPPLILCGSPIGLPRADEIGLPGGALRADDWHGYPRSCRALLRAILDAGVTDAVMLCGDPHYSCVVRVEAQDRRGPVVRRCRLHVIVASGLNASLPFANGHPRELLRGRVRLPFSNAGLCAWATATPLSSAPRQYSEFAVHLDARGTRHLEVAVFDEHGARVASHRIDLPAAGARVNRRPGRGGTRRPEDRAAPRRRR